jgi:hypothetical protein
MPGAAAPCVGNHIKCSVHLTERLNSPFAIIYAGVGRLDDLRVLEDQRGLQKIDFPELPVFPPLAFVPGK